MTRSLMAALPKVVASFQLRDSEGPLRPFAPQAGVPMTSVQMLVAIAAGDPNVERRRKQAADAEKGLKALERLHVELVAGAPSVERLREIADWTRDTETPEEPMLAQIMSEIDLRVRVELAKLDIEV